MPRSAFLIDVFGLFGPEQLRIEWREEVRPAHEELDRLIEHTWREQLELSRQRGGHLFNGQLARYLRHRQRDGELLIEAGPTDYAAFMGTNYLNHHRGDEFGWERYSNPIGTSATVITSDGWLLYGRRNDKVACHTGYVHSLGGGLEGGERREDGTLDAFASISRELHEEAGIRPEDIQELVCLGMIRDPYVRQPELIFDATVRLTLQELEQRVQVGDDEHTGLVTCRDEATAPLPFIRQTEKIAPVAIGAICLHGRRCFGEDWFREIVRELPPPAAP